MNFFSDYKTFIAAIRRMVKNENTYIAEVIVCNKNVSVDKSQVEALLLEFIEKENKVN